MLRKTLIIWIFVAIFGLFITSCGGGEKTEILDLDTEGEIVQTNTTPPSSNEIEEYEEDINSRNDGMPYIVCSQQEDIEFETFNEHLGKISLITCYLNENGEKVDSLFRVMDIANKKGTRTTQYKTNPQTKMIYIIKDWLNPKWGFLTPEEGDPLFGRINITVSNNLEIEEYEIEWINDNPPVNDGVSWVYYTPEITVDYYGNGVILGRIYNPNFPLKYETLELQNTESGEIYTKFSNVSGKFSFSDIPQGEYELYVLRPRERYSINGEVIKKEIKIEKEGLLKINM